MISYFTLGLLLVTTGLSVSVSYFFLGLTPFVTDAGLAMLILGSTSLGLAQARSCVISDDQHDVSKACNLLLLTLAAGFIATDSLLALFNQENLEIYFIISVNVYFVTAWLYITRNPWLRNALTTVGVVIFTGLLVLITIKIIRILK